MYHPESPSNSKTYSAGCLMFGVYQHICKDLNESIINLKYQEISNRFVSCSAGMWPRARCHGLSSCAKSCLSAGVKMSWT